MRMHIQAYKKKLPRNGSQINKVSNLNSPLLTCYSCGKKFSSMKSLFGHMKSHPERKWRGIQPPNPHIVIDILTPKFDDRTNSRAAATMSRSFNGGSGSKSEFNTEAISDLMLLAQECDLEANKNEIGERKPELDRVLKRRRELRDTNEEEKSDDEDNEKVMKKNIKIKIKKIKSNQLDLEVTAVQNHKQSPSIRTYKCRVCGKKFPNPQALGGHRSNHKKIKKMKIVADNVAKIPPQEDGSTIAAADGTEEAESSIKTMSSLEQIGQNVMSIDLNELPIMTNEEYAEWGLLLFC